MRRWHLLILSVLWVGGVLAYKFWPEEEIIHPPGILVVEEPQQRPVSHVKSWEHNSYKITPLAEFKLRARVLHKRSYWSGREADLSPLDLALGWGTMSDQKIVEQISISQSKRWYFWRAARLPVSEKVITVSSSNMHMIPATREIEEQLQSLHRGKVIQLSGYLVMVAGDDGWKWRSSLSRTDTGDGSCELVWVERLSIQD